MLKRKRREKWQQIEPGVRKVVKDNVANSIFAAGPLARLVTPQVIAKIGVIEIKPGDNQWPDLVMGLVGTAARADLADGPREASLKALGFLLEELDEYEESPLLQNEVDAALTAVCGCMGHGSVPVQRAAVNALYDALPFVAQNFEDDHQAERNAIMMAVCSATQVEDADVKRSAFECISRIAELYYDHLADYMKVLAELTATAARSKDEKISCNALDFWAQLAEEEADRRENEGAESKNYILTALKPLVEMVFEIMAQHQADEDADFGPLENAQAVLQKSARAVGHQIVDAIMPYVNANFVSPDPLRRDAAVMSFALIMEGPDKERLQNEIIKPALPHLLSKLEGPTRDPSPIVRSSAAFALGNIFAEHLTVLAPYPQADFVNIVQLLCRALEDEPVVVKYTAVALDNLIKGMHDDVEEFMDKANDRRTMLSPLFYHVINALMTRSDKPDWYVHDVRVNCYMCITSVIEAAGADDETVLIAFLNNCLLRLNTSVQKTLAPAAAPGASALTTEERLHEVALQEKLCSMINEIFLQVRDAAKPAADAVASIMTRIVSARAGAEQEAILCLSTLGLVVESEYERYMPIVYPLLRDAMLRSEDHATAKYAVMAISDVARALGERFMPVAGEVVDILKGILVNQEVMRALKPPALSAFADIALALGPKVEDYMVNMLVIIKSAAKTDIPSHDEDLIEYLTEVRKSAMEAWSGLFLAFGPVDDDAPAAKHHKQQRAVACLGPCLPELRDVIFKWASDWKRAVDASTKEGQEWRPDFALLQGAVQILGDMAQTLPNSVVAPFLTRRSPEIMWLCQLERQMNRDEYPEDEPLAVYANKFLPP